MLPAALDRAPIALRCTVLVVASVLLGAAAHVASSGHAGLHLGPILVTTALVAVAVSAILGTGAWVGGLRPGSRWASTVEDLSAGIALVASQLLVHWLSQPVASTLAAGISDPGAHHGTATTAHAATVAHTGWGMGLGHATAALVVGLLLRWLERCALRLGVAVRHAVRVVAGLGADLRPPRDVAVTSRSASRVHGESRPPAALVVLRSSVVRRGPPLGMAAV